jgi:heme/copper-type cytochrome/quinol oxidase subunit 2
VIRLGEIYRIIMGFFKKFVNPTHREIGASYLDPLAKFKLTTYNFTSRTKRFSHHVSLELVWTLIPIIILILIAVPSLKLLYYIENPFYIANGAYPSLNLHIIGQQWFWNYDYLSSPVTEDFIFGKETTEAIVQKKQQASYMISEEDVIVINGLRLLEVDFPLILPINTRINFFITSADVLHAWSVPSLGIKVDAVPGRLSSVSTLIRWHGILYGQCSEICGVGHGFMPIKLSTV